MLAFQHEKLYDREHEHYYDKAIEDCLQNFAHYYMIIIAFCSLDCDLHDQHADCVDHCANADPPDNLSLLVLLL